MPQPQRCFIVIHLKKIEEQNKQQGNKRRNRNKTKFYHYLFQLGPGAPSFICRIARLFNRTIKIFSKILFHKQTDFIS